MRAGFLVFLAVFVLFYSRSAFGQKSDSIYIQSYPQRIRLLGYIATNYIEIKEGSNHFIPNYPLTPGIGIAIKNTAINMRLGYGIIPLKSNTRYGKTKSLDIQAHSYWRRFMLDLSFQQYKGFFTQDKNRAVTGVYPGMSVLQIGAEGVYLFKGNKFSVRAAFEQSEKQLRSAGSFLLGGGMYFHRVTLDKNIPYPGGSSFDNFQLGVNAGYGYSWVMDKHWLLSAMATIGANFGNEPGLLKDGKIEIYPTANGRFASSYHKDGWAAAISIFVGNKSVYSLENNKLSLTSLTMQLSYVKHLDNIFRKKN